VAAIDGRSEVDNAAAAGRLQGRITGQGDGLIVGLVARGLDVGADVIEAGRGEAGECRAAAHRCAERVGAGRSGVDGEVVSSINGAGEVDGIAATGRLQRGIAGQRNGLVVGLVARGLDVCTDVIEAGRGEAGQCRAAAHCCTERISAGRSGVHGQVMAAIYGRSEVDNAAAAGALQGSIGTQGYCAIIGLIAGAGDVCR